MSRLARVAAVLVAAGVGCAPAAHAAPDNPLCESGTYRKAHPLICDTGAIGGPAAFPGTGGGGSGGLLGAIGDAIGGLTGGLL